MEIKLRGEMTIADIRQALFEQLHELETKYAVKFSRGATLYIDPTNSFGEDVIPRMAGGQELRKLYSTGPYRSAADQGKRVTGARGLIQKPHYIGLEEARQVLAEMGVALSPRQMKRAADMDAQADANCRSSSTRSREIEDRKEYTAQHLHEGAGRGREQFANMIYVVISIQP